MLQGMISDIFRGHEEIMQLTRGKEGGNCVCVECRGGKRWQKSEGHLAWKHCVLVTGGGRRACTRYSTGMKKLIRLMRYF